MIKWYHILIVIASFALGWYLAQKEPVVKIEYKDKPVPYKVDSIVYQTDTLKLPPDPIDTNAVVADYYRDRAFDTTIVVNEVKLNVGGSVFENRLQGLNFDIANLRPTKIEVIPTWEISGGAIIGTDLFAPSIYTGYKNHEFGVGYNVMGEQGIIVSYKYTFFRP